MRALITSFILASCIAFAGLSGSAQARGGYAGWLKHGDAYRVSGAFAGYKGSIRVQVKWRGNRFVVSTPLGTFPLQRAGNGVKFRVKFEKSWASVTWINSRALVIWKGQRGSARVSKIDSRRIIQTRGDTLK